jgi:hypothetical protein
MQAVADCVSGHSSSYRAFSSCCFVHKQNLQSVLRIYSLALWFSRTTQNELAQPCLKCVFTSRSKPRSYMFVSDLPALSMTNLAIVAPFCAEYTWFLTKSLNGFRCPSAKYVTVKANQAASIGNALLVRNTRTKWIRSRGRADRPHRVL